MNEPEAKLILKNYENLLMELRQIGQDLNKLLYNKSCCLDQEFPEIQNGDVQFQWEEYFRSESDTNYINFPFSYLWTENWLEIEKAKIEEKKQKEQAEKEEKIRKRKIEAEEQERKLYEQLKAKFEGK